MSKVKRYTHHPRLTPKQVLEARKRVLPGGDLHGRGLVSIGRAYNVGPGEMSKALGGLVAYESFPQEGKITDYAFLTNANPNTDSNPLQRLLVSATQSEHSLQLGTTQPTQETDKEKETTMPSRTFNLTPEQVAERSAKFRETWNRKALHISDAEIIAIRNEYLAGSSVPEITARHPGMGQHTIHRIIYGQGRWDNLPSLKGRGGSVKRNTETASMIPASTPAPQLTPAHPTLPAGTPAGMEYKVDGKLLVEDVKTPAAQPPQVPQVQTQAPVPVEATRLPAHLPSPAPAPVQAQATSVAPALDNNTILAYMLNAVGPDTLGWMPKPKDRSILSMAEDLEEAASRMLDVAMSLRAWASAAHEVAVPEVVDAGASV